MYFHPLLRSFGIFRMKLIKCLWRARERQNGELWLYPRKSEILIHGEDALTDYMFGEKRTAHRFCGTCGVSIFNQPLNPKVDMLPVNTRTIQGVNLTDLNVEMKYFPPVTFIED